MGTRNVNYVANTIGATFGNEERARAVRDAYNEAAERFSSVNMLIGVAYAESQQAVDMIDDMGRRRHAVKRWMAQYERQWRRYANYMRGNMDADAWSLLQDYSNAAHGRIDGGLTILRISCKDYLDRNGVRDSMLLATCETAVMVWKIAVELYERFFEEYRERLGFDISRDFSYADMGGCAKAWANVVDAVARDVGASVDFGDDKRCVDSWTALVRSLGEDFFNGSAADALRLNDAIREKYSDVLGEALA